MFLRRSVYVSGCYFRMISNSYLVNNTRKFATVKLEAKNMLQNRVTLDQKQSLIWRLLNKLKLWDVNELRLGKQGYCLYEKTVNSIDFKNFIQTFSLPDTFNTWFLIMELHLWMVSVRLMVEGNVGLKIRNSMYELMWQDASKRVYMLKKINRKALFRQLEEIKTQFRPALVGYDEGLLKGDTVLAGALWRRFFNQECYDAEQVEILITFIRKQILQFDKLPIKKFIKNDITWLSLHDK